jgi:glycosyltransferase involved in cell wall biosynthesis
MQSYRKSSLVPVNVSVVIPTYGRGDRLGATLDALLASDTSGLDAVDIIVVDDGSPKPIASVLVCAYRLYNSL